MERKKKGNVKALKLNFRMKGSGENAGEFPRGSFPGRRRRGMMNSQAKGPDFDEALESMGPFRRGGGAGCTEEATF